MSHLVIGTAGHIDHGKSALVRALTGIDPDRLKEEKARGITIDLGFAHDDARGTTFAFVDVPGHERFVKNMLAGATGIDFVLLVIAADESVMPQTREHFDICRLLRIGGGIVALTKSDLVDEDTLEVVRGEARELVAGSFLEDAPIVPVSARTGAGLEDLRAALDRLTQRPSIRRTSGPVRLPIDRVFTMKGFGPVVTGTLVSGRIAANQELQALPMDRHVRVRAVQVHGRSAAFVKAGQRTAVNLGGIDVAELSRGETLATPGAFEPTRWFDASLEMLAGARPLRHGARVRFHYGTSEILGRVGLVESTGASATEPPTHLEPGSSGYVRFRLEKPAVLTRGDRFVVRSYSPSVTIAGGQVLDPAPPRGAIRTPAGRRRYQRLDSLPADREASVIQAILVFVQERGAAGLPIAALITRAGIAPESVDSVMRTLIDTTPVTRAGDVLIATAVLAELENRLRAALVDHHKQQPLSDGVPREEIHGRLFGRSPDAIFERAIEDLVAAGELIDGERLAMASHTLTLSTEENAARERIERSFHEAGLCPPDVALLAGTMQLANDVVDRMVTLLVRQKVLVNAGDLVFHAEALQRLKGDVSALKASSKGQATMDVASFKARYGVSRKFAIPLLQYLDRERVTRRIGDSRILV